MSPNPEAIHKKPLVSLKQHLHRRLCGDDVDRSHTTVHASDLMKEDRPFCPREFCLKDLTGYKSGTSFLSTSLAVTFHLGHVLQDSVTRWLADLGMAYGVWECLGCGQHTGISRRPGACSSCGHKHMQFHEPRFVSEETGVSSGIDILVRREDNKLWPLEIKTMDKDKFKELKMPLAEHRWRTNLYLRVIHDSGRPERKYIRSNKAIVLYVSKGGYGCADKEVADFPFADDAFSPFKEFVIERDDEVTEEMWQKAKLVKEFRDKTGPMPRGICEHQLEPRAQACPMISTCFGGTYPGVVG